MKTYMVLIFSKDFEKHWTRYYDLKAEALDCLDKAVAQGFEAELYRRFANCEYRRIY